MIDDLFPPCLSAVLAVEGGFVDDPQDPGGMTNLGVTAGAWQGWVGHAPSQAEMRALTPDVVGPFYRANYWRAVNGDALPPGVNLVLFDHAVNAGAGRAGRLVQALIGAVQDGNIGPRTLEALQQWVGSHSLGAAVHQLMDGRRAFYQSRPGFPRFGQGWINRCTAIEMSAMRMVPT